MLIGTKPIMISRFLQFDKLNQTFDALAAWHQKQTGYAVLDRVKISRLSIFLMIVTIMLAAIINYQIRQSQYQVWQDNKPIFFLEDTPLFSTTDASYFLGLARQYQQTGNVRDFDAKRLTPYYKELAADQEPLDSAFDFPLLSVLIAKLSPDSSSQSLLKIGNALIPIFGFVMVLGIVLAFGASGFWLEGAMAASGAGLSYAFLVRTSIGRIDTDILNLGFFYAVLGLTIFAGRAQSWRSAIIWTVLAGLMLNLFFWWYEQAFMGWAFTVGLIWLSFIVSRDWRRPLVLAVIFALISGLAFKSLGIFGSNYLSDEVSTGALIFPQTFNTITELRVVPFLDILDNLTGTVWLGIYGVAGLVLFGLRHPVLAVVYGPASVFALANFLVGNRAIFYSAPMIWFGIAFLTMIIIRLIWSKAPEKWHQFTYHRELLSAGVIVIMLGVHALYAPTAKFVPNVTFPKEIMRGFAAMKGNLPADSVIASWWDYGYASQFFNGYATLHDGGAQTTPVTHYVARALLAPTQTEAHHILRFLAADGYAGIRANNQSYEAIESRLREGPVNDVPPVFLVLTEQMAGWIGSISTLGLWDTQKGEPIQLAARRPDSFLFYGKNNCTAGASPTQMICNNLPVDLDKGTIDNRPVLRAITKSVDGNIMAGRLFNEDATVALHLAEQTGVGSEVLSFHERLAQTTFHKLYHLGQVDDERFEMVYDDFPHMRIFRLK